MQASVKSRRHTNRLSTIMVGGKLVEDKRIIERHIVNHFKNQFVKHVALRPTLLGLTFKQIITSQNTWLTRPFELPEVEAILVSLSDDKAHGIDGFPLRGYQAIVAFYTG